MRTSYEWISIAWKMIRMDNVLTTIAPSQAGDVGSVSSAASSSSSEKKEKEASVGERRGGDVKEGREKFMERRSGTVVICKHHYFNSYIVYCQVETSSKRSIESP
jgi:hypothetical protein